MDARVAREPIHLVVTESETCLRIVRLESVRVVIKKPVEEPLRAPRAAPVERPQDVEPFPGYKWSTVWPPDQALSVPDVRAGSASSNVVQLRAAAADALGGAPPGSRTARVAVPPA